MSAKPEIVPVAAEIPRPETRPNLPDPAPIKTHDIDWKILTEKSIISEGEAYFALSPKDYEELALTMADIIRWIKEAGWRLNYYKGENIEVKE